MLREYYRAQLNLPVEPDLAIFSAYWYRGYACNPAAIHAKLRELAPGIRALWVVRRDLADRLPRDVDHVVAGPPPTTGPWPAPAGWSTTSTSPTGW